MTNANQTPVTPDVQQLARDVFNCTKQVSLKDNQFCASPLYEWNETQAAALITAFMAGQSGWRHDMCNAPRDGTVLNLVARYPDATAGFPQYGYFCDGKWFANGRIPNIEIIPWAWRERDEWPTPSEVGKSPADEGASK